MTQFLFLQKDLKSVMGIKRVLQFFELLSGLQINYSKSVLYEHRSEVIENKLWAAQIGYEVGAPTIIFFEMPHGLNPRCKSFWSLVTDIIRMNLSCWKSMSLNQAGKLVLLKLTLDSLLNYWFNLFIMPKNLQIKNDKIRPGFFLGGC